MPGLLNPRRGGLLGAPMIRQIAVPQGQPGPPLFMGMGGGQVGGPPAYGSDAWALQTGGPGAMIFREMARGGVYRALDPKTKTFSPWLRQYLGPQFQKGK